MAQNQTLDLSRAFTSLSTALSALPPSLNATRLAHALDSWSQINYDPFVSSLEAVEATQIAVQAASGAAAGSQAFLTLVERVPQADRVDVDAQTLREMVKLGVASTSFDIECWWAPEVFAIAIMFALAIYFELGKTLLLSRRAISRVRHKAESEENKRNMTVEEARMKLTRSAKSILGHFANLVLSTICITLQCMAWRLFVLPSMPLRLQDIRYLSFCMKLLATGYAADLLFGDVHFSIYAHHIFTFALLLVGQLAAFHTSSPKFFRMAQYLILQATLEQTTYGAMVAWHAYKWLAVQNPDPSRQTRLQRKCLWTSYILLRITQATTYPQKCLPIAMAWYWGVRMWNQVDDTPFGRYWLAWFASLATLLLILQLKFIDETWPLTDHVRYTLHGGRPPISRSGPIMRRLMRCFGRSRPAARPSRDSILPSPTSPASSHGSSMAKNDDLERGETSPGHSRATTVIGTLSPKRSDANTILLPSRPPVSQVFGSQQSFLTFATLMKPNDLETPVEDHKRPQLRGEASSASMATTMVMNKKDNLRSRAASSASSSAFELDQMPSLSMTAPQVTQGGERTSVDSESIYLDGYDEDDAVPDQGSVQVKEETMSIAQSQDEGESPFLDASSALSVPSQPSSPAFNPLELELSTLISELDLDSLVPSDSGDTTKVQESDSGAMTVKAESMKDADRPSAAQP